MDAVSVCVLICAARSSACMRVDLGWNTLAGQRGAQVRARCKPEPFVFFLHCIDFTCALGGAVRSYRLAVNARAAVRVHSNSHTESGDKTRLRTVCRRLRASACVCYVDNHVNMSFMKVLSQCHRMCTHTKNRIRWHALYHKTYKFGISESQVEYDRCDKVLS